MLTESKRHPMSNIPKNKMRHEKPLKDSHNPIIKASHKGLLHKKLHVPEGSPIPHAKLMQAAHSGSPSERKEAQFAINFNK